MNEEQAKTALDHIAKGLGDGPGAQSISDWFVSATVFQQAVASLKKLNIGYDKILSAVNLVLSMCAKYGPDIATIVAKIVEEGRAVLYPEG